MNVGTGEFFAKLGDAKPDGKKITLTQSDKWLKQAKVFDNEQITTTDTIQTFQKTEIINF